MPLAWLLTLTVGSAPPAANKRPAGLGMGLPVFQLAKKMNKGAGGSGD